jgi:hypothetical protein
MVKKILINYADLSHYESQKKNCSTGMIYGMFDSYIAYSKKDIDPAFCNQYNRILSQKRGAGYWLWKPYIILKTLESINDGDYLFYCDSGSEFISNINHIIELGQNITLFHLDPVPGNIQAIQTKRDAFVLMGCEKYAFYPNVTHAGFQLYKKCEESISFVREYLLYCCDERILTDMPNLMGWPDYIEFQNHRHDQSVLSLLACKHGIKTHRDLTQYGNPYRKPWEYPQIINHTRNSM